MNMEGCSSMNLIDSDVSVEDILRDLGDDTSGFDHLLLETYENSDPCNASRFMEVADIDAFKDSRIPKNTRMKVTWAVKIFNEWLGVWRVRYVDGICKVLKPFNDMSSNEMDYCFQYFFSEVRKQDCSLYPPRTLKEIAACLQHYINYTLKVTVSIFKDQCFLNTREALDAAMKASARAGTMKPRKRAAVVSWVKEEEMWTSGAFGCSSPQQLIDTLMYHLGLHLSLRAIQEHRDLEFGINSQLQLKKDANGDEVLYYVERTSKSKTGGLNQCRGDPKVTTINANQDTTRCVIMMYKNYLSHR